MKMIKIESCQECPCLRLSYCFETKETTFQCIEDDREEKTPQKLFKSCPLEDMPTLGKRYTIKPEGLGEINIDEDENGEWVRFEDPKEKP